MPASKRKDLFEGLAITKTDFEWKKHPVLHFNFGFAAAATSYEQFESMLNDEIERALGEVGCEFDPKRALGSNFARAIDALAARAMRGEGELPVILVDEFDDPVAKVLHDVPFAEKVRTLLATFYGQLKDRTEKYRFLMITGVSKFTKMSIFSTLSNLIDISFDDDYAMMLGYTEQELYEYFDDRMRIQAEKMGMTDEAYRAELRRLCFDALVERVGYVGTERFIAVMNRELEDYTLWRENQPDEEESIEELGAKIMEFEAAKEELVNA